MKDLFRKILAVGALTLFLIGFSNAGERMPSPVAQDMRPFPDLLEPKVQDDDFSCGFLALSAIYESYGLDPAKYRLRERLGTSVPAIPFVESSTGTLQADLFRVLKQDGFDATPINPKDPADLQKLTNHLRGYQYALALVSTERAGGLHWIVFTHYDRKTNEVQIGDSLVEGLHRQNLSKLAEKKLLRVILLEPTLPNPSGGYWLAQLRGIGEMALTLPPLLLALVLLVSFGLAVAGFFIARKVLRPILARLREVRC